MVNLLFLILLPVLSWADCSGFPDALSKCQVYECAVTPVRSQPKIQIKKKILGFKDETCLYETDTKMTGKVLCEVKKENLGVEVEMVSYELEMMSKMSESEDMDPSKLMNQMTEMMTEIKKIAAKRMKLNEEKDPCTAQDPEKLSKLAQGLKGLGKSLQPSMIHFSNDELKETFPNEEPACLIMSSHLGFSDGKDGNIVSGYGALEDCKKLEKATCTDIFTLGKLTEQMCPAEFYAIHLDPKIKIPNKDKYFVPGTFINSFTCDIHGLMKRGKKSSTFDPEFAQRSVEFCRLPDSYECSFELFDMETKKNLKSSHITFKRRPGVEVKCLQAAKKEAANYCDERKNVYVMLDVVVKYPQDQVSLTGQTIFNFCHSLKWKKYFY